MAMYKMDTTHSEIEFKVRHLMISNVSGKFKTFDGTLEADKEDFSDAKVHFEADIDSIDTNNADRDAHLKSPDFFDAAQYPKLVFESTGVENMNGESFKLNGNLTIHGVTKPVSLDATFNGAAKDGWGNAKAGFEASAKISRKDFGLTWNMATEAGGVVVSDEVKIQLDVQFIKQA
jgi:polyisoprenoid-binding protein YceI